MARPKDLFFTLCHSLALGPYENDSLARIILSILPDLEFCVDQIHLQKTECYIHYPKSSIIVLLGIYPRGLIQKMGKLQLDVYIYFDSANIFRSCRVPGNVLQAHEWEP